MQEGALASGWTPEKAAGKEVTPLTQLKYQIGRHGYGYNAEGMMQAVWDADLEAVDLFLQAGMSPDTVGSNGIAPLMYSAMYCTRDPAEKRVALALKLIAAKAKVDVKDDNGSTPLLWAAQSCPAVPRQGPDRRRGGRERQGQGGRHAVDDGRGDEPHRRGGPAQEGRRQALEIGRCR